MHDQLKSHAHLGINHGTGCVHQREADPVTTLYETLGFGASLLYGVRHFICAPLFLHNGKYMAPGVLRREANDCHEMTKRFRSSQSYMTCGKQVHQRPAAFRSTRN